MKHFLFIALTGISFLSLTTLAQTTPVEEEQLSDDYTAEIVFLERLHSAQQQIQTLKDGYEKLENEKLRTDLINQRYEAMENCNINLLSSVYENPKEAWQNITKSYDEKELKLTLDVLSSTPKKTSTGEDAHSEVMAHWHLGRDVLQDVYADPQKYGKVKEGQSFDLWEDQKYLYADDVTNFITAVNTVLGRTGRIPGVSSENNFEKNEAAYQAFLSSLPADMLAKLSEAQKVFPKPPKALPPAHEIMWFNEDPSKAKVVFPEWPSPWKKFIQSGFEKYNPTGEMAETFLPKSLVLKEEIRHQTTDEQNNRLNVYQALKKEKAGAQKVLNIVKNGQEKSVNGFTQNLKELGLEMTIDSENIDSLLQVEQELISLKTKNIKSVRDKITRKNSDILDTKNKPQKFNEYLKLSYPEKITLLDTLEKDSEDYRTLKQVLFSSRAYQDYNYVNALEKDISGEINFTTANAQNIDHMVKENQARKELFKKIKEKQKNDIKNTYNKKINKRCLNGGL